MLQASTVVTRVFAGPIAHRDRVGCNMRTRSFFGDKGMALGLAVDYMADVLVQCAA